MMLKLIRLEWKKNHIENHIRNVILLAVFLCGFLFAMAYLGIANDPDTGVPDAAPGAENISSPIELLTSMSFLIYTGVMLSSFIVSAYKNKTMNLMFSYPIKRYKVLISQMLAVWIFNFAALTVTKFLIYGCVALGARSMQSAFPLDFQMGSLEFWVQLILKSAVIVTVGFIALYVGLLLKSSKATIIASFLLILLTQANVGDLTLADNQIFPAALTVISLVFAFLSVRGVEKKDLM